MNYIKHLTGFFDRIVQDRSLNPTHISLYISLFQSWNINRFQNPISITRDEIMRISKICSKATYHKCMRELNDKGYIQYEPSFNPFKGSMVILFNFSDDLKPVQKRDSINKKISPVDEQLLNKRETSNETSTEQALVPSINYINNTNTSNDQNVQTQAKNLESNNAAFLDNDTETSQEKKLREKKKGFSPPSSDEIKTYFSEQNFPEIEAQKFFNFFSSIDWLVGGKTPMANWQASAQNWMLNSNHLNTHTKTLHYNADKNNEKNYAEPL